MNKNQNIEILKKKIFRFRNKFYLLKFINETLSAISLFLILMFVISFIESFLHSGSDVRKFEFITLIIFSIILFSIKLLPSLVDFIRKKNLAQTAGIIGKLNLLIKDELQNIIELSESEKYHGSEDLINAGIDRITKQLSSENFNSYLSLSVLKKSLINFIVVIFIIISTFFFTDTLKAVESILFFNSEIFEREKAVWDIQPGSTSVIKGENVEIRIKLSGIQTSTITLYYKNKTNSEWSSRQLIEDTLQTFTHIIKQIEYDTQYYFATGNYKSEENSLLVIDYPKINSFSLKIIPPAYSGSSPVFQRDNGNITALKGSNILYSINASKELVSASIKFTNDSLAMRVSNKNAEIDFILNETEEYFVAVTDSSGYKNRNPISYSINILNDNFPEIELIQPKTDTKLGALNSVQYEIKISDDYGFRKLNLFYRFSKSLYGPPSKDFIKVNLDISSRQLEQTKYFLWNLDSLNLAAGDELSYYFEIEDNDNVSGPKKNKTAILKIIVPSIDEILSEADQVYEDTFAELDESFEEAEKLKEEFEKINNELKKKDPALKYEEKEKIKEALRKYEELIDKAKAVSEKLNELKEKLSENNLLSEETLKKYEELQNLFEEIGSEELKKAFQEMNKLLDQMNRKNVQNKFEQIKFNEEQFQKSIERTLNLLRRLQIEQKVEDLKNRVENILKEQNEIMNNNSNDNINRLTKKQENISKQSDELNSAAKDLIDSMQKMEKMPIDAMENILEKIENQNNKSESDKAKNQMEMGSQQEARSSQQKIQDNMESLQKDISQMQESMQKKNQLETLYELMRIFNGLLELAESQENVLSKLKESDTYSGDFSELAKEEHSIDNKLGNLFIQLNRLGQKTFLVTPEMGRTLGNARREINNSINQLSDSRQAQSLKSTENALTSLNEASLYIKKMLELLMNNSGSGSGGGMSMMQQLKNMGQQQMNLNQMTQKMLQGEKLTSEQMNQMQRLAQQQEMIRKSLEELNRENKESGRSKTVSQNLDRVLEEMKEVIKKMHSNNFDEEFKQQQDKILSKLLDAQKSINDRDFEDKRESVSGQTIRRMSPEELLNLNNISDQLKEELLKSLKEGYNKDYEDLIRKYFEELQKKKNRN